jgi:hypothetical protein
MRVQNVVCSVMTLESVRMEGEMRWEGRGWRYLA